MFFSKKKNQKLFIYASFKRAATLGGLRTAHPIASKNYFGAASVVFLAAFLECDFFVLVVLAGAIGVAAGAGAAIGAGAGVAGAGAAKAGAASRAAARTAALRGANFMVCLTLTKVGLRVRHTRPQQSV